MSDKFIITVRATGYLINNGEEALSLIEPIIDRLTYEDEYIEATKTLGWLYDKEHDLLFLHKGIDLNYITQYLGKCKILFRIGEPFREMGFEYEEIIAPRDKDQEDVIDFIAGQGPHLSNKNDSQIFLVKKPGFGKAEPYSRKIPTPTAAGYTLMRDIKVGDMVFNRHGKPCKVISIFEQGEKDIYKITFNDGRYAMCCEDHLWCITTHVMRHHNKYMVKDTKYLLKHYKYAKKHTDDTCDPYSYRFMIPRSQAVQYPKQNVPIDPWVLGCFIGNGCLHEKALSISSGTDEIPKRIAKIYSFSIYHNSINNTYTFKDEFGHLVKTVDFFKDIPEIVGCYSHEKYIPKIYMINDPDTRLNLLRGLMDADGSISYNEGRYNTTYTSTSKMLINDIRWMLYSFGFSGNCYVNKRVEKYTKSTWCGTLVFRTPIWFKQLMFTVSYKCDSFKRLINTNLRNVRYDNLLIKDIQFSHRENAKCIMVDDPEHLYLTENFIVTHNTFCSGVGLCKLGYKTLIITHRDSLRQQWLKSLYTMNGLNSSIVHEIVDTNEVYDIANGNVKLDYDVYLMTHATFRASLNKIHDIKKVMAIPKNLGIGLKIIDEAHLEFKDTLIMDMLFNIRRNLYLTATDGRSSKEENSIFRYVFTNATFYKPGYLIDPNASSTPRKWVEYHTVFVNTQCKPMVYRYKVAGGRGMSPSSYGKWVIQYDKKKRHLKCIRDIIKMTYENDSMAKVLVFVPLIELCEECAFFLKREFDNDDSFKYDLDIRTINSKNSPSDNEYAKNKADVIVSTIQSCGTGTDIAGVTTMVVASPLVSKIIAEQVHGRLRWRGKKCQYYDIVDTSVQMDRIWWKSRCKKLKHLSLSSDTMYWTEDKDKSGE